MLHRSRCIRQAALVNGASPPRTCISLGGWCGPALILGKLGLRTEAYPFDFSRVTADGLLHFLQHGFEHGFYPPGPPPYRPECVGPWVLFRGQHTAFAHFDLNSAAVQAHFTVKMQRLHRVLDAPTRPVTFFRTVTARCPLEELRLAHQLEDLLARRNPSLDFRIVWMVHDQGLLAHAVQLAPLSPRMALWALRYSTRDESLSLFDRTHDAYRTVVLHSIAEENWPCAKEKEEGEQQEQQWCASSPLLSLPDDVCDRGRRVVLADRDLRTSDVAFADMTAERFPWRSHDNLALIDGVASVGGTCAGIGSTQMLCDPAEPWRPKKCRYCGDSTYHAAGPAHRTGRPFTDEEDQLILVHLYKILTGGDKVAAVEQLAHEMQRGTYEIILRIQYLTNSSTKIMDAVDPVGSDDDG